MYHIVHLIELLTEGHLEEEVTVVGRLLEVAYLIDWVYPAVTVKAVQVDMLVSQPWLLLHGVKSQ